MTDMTVQDHGSLFLLQARTPAAEAWIEENVEPDARRWGDAIVVEHRYISNIIQGVISDGLTVEER